MAFAVRDEDAGDTNVGTVAPIAPNTSFSSRDCGVINSMKNVLNYSITFPKEIFSTSLLFKLLSFLEAT